jgi:type VI secretion system protein ImpA
MASAEVLDFSALLAPIPGDHPAGTDPRADPNPVSLFQMVKEARKAARAVETRFELGELINNQPPPPPDWQPLLEKATRLLTENSKDMEVTAYLIEALTRKKGLVGLRDGFRLARELMEKYWDGLFPGDTDPPDAEARFSHLLQLNGIDRPGTLIAPIRKIPFTAGINDGFFSLSHYHSARSLSQLSDANLRQRKIDAGSVTLEKINRAVAETPASFYGNLIDDLHQSLDEFDRFRAVVSEKAGYDATGSDIHSVLDEYQDVVKELAGSKIPKPVAPPADGKATTPDATSAPGAAGAATAPSGAIGGREDALRRLEQIAEYFRVSEPQSILPYALDQIVAWGRMPLPDLLAELIPEDEPRRGLFKKVGIKPVESST